MNYELIKVTPDGNGVCDTRQVMAISTTEKALINHCQTVYGLPAGKPDEFSWASYYVIEPTNIEIIPSI